MVLLERVGLTLTSAAARVNVLTDIELAIETGDRVAVLGPSGAGKSSLLALIAGLERPTSGRVTVAGHDLGALDEDGLARFRRRHIGIVFQSFHLIPTLTARENVSLPLELAGAADAEARADAALAAVGLGRRVGHYPLELSGGEQQRVAIARAVVVEPRVLLADEPTGNLDGRTGEAIADLLIGLAERRGATLVLVTHNETLARRCRRMVRLADGRVVAPVLSAAN
ncbi:MAG: ATP-binding cassette domain-containing protein [Alphaproteobacteria bacterium]